MSKDFEQLSTKQVGHTSQVAEIVNCNHYGRRFVLKNFLCPTEGQFFFYFMQDFDHSPSYLH